MVMFNVPHALRYVAVSRFRKDDILRKRYVTKKDPLPCRFNVQTFLKIRDISTM